MGDSRLQICGWNGVEGCVWCCNVLYIFIIFQVCTEADLCGRAGNREETKKTDEENAGPRAYVRILWVCEFHDVLVEK